MFPYENFNDEEDAKALKQAFKGFGTDEDAVIEIITRRSNEQRRQIATTFKTMYGKVGSLRSIEMYVCSHYSIHSYT